MRSKDNFIKPQGEKQCACGLNLKGGSFAHISTVTSNRI